MTEDDDWTREYFDKLVLIEAIVEGLADAFRMDEFGQMQLAFPDDPMRRLVGYDEGLLQPMGKLLYRGKRIACMDQARSGLRFSSNFMTLSDQCNGRAARWPARL